MNEWIVIGGGGHAAVIADMITKNNDLIIAFIDDNIPEGTSILGATVEEISSINVGVCTKAVIAIGNNAIREKKAKELSLNFSKIKHPSSIIANDAVIGEGTVLMAGSIVNPRAYIGKHCIINTGAIIEHDCKIGDFAHISPGVVMGGNVTIGKGAHIGVGATIKNNINICDNVVVGAGAVVVKDILKPGTYVGVPAKELR